MSARSRSWRFVCELRDESPSGPKSHRILSIITPNKVVLWRTLSSPTFVISIHFENPHYVAWHTKRNVYKASDFTNIFFTYLWQLFKLFLSLLSKDNSLSERETARYVYIYIYVENKTKTKHFRFLSLLSKDNSLSERETTYTLTYTLTKSVPKVSRNWFQDTCVFRDTYMPRSLSFRETIVFTK